MRTLREWYRYLDQQARLVEQMHRSPAATEPTPEPAAIPPVRAGLAEQAAQDARLHARRTRAAGRALPKSPGRPPALRDRQEVLRRLLDPEVSLHDAAALLNLSKSTLRRYTAAGRLRSFRTPGGQRRFRLSDLLTFMEQTGRM